MTIDRDLTCIEIETAPDVDKSIIWLHGLGADGSDFVPIISELQLPQSLNIRFVFPHAPVRPVTINNNYEMRAWFDIYGLTLQSKIDREGIAESVAAIDKLIEKELSRGITPNNIILAGFSQGSAIALTTGLCYSKQLAGIIALSGYLPLAEEIFKRSSEANRHIPIFICHGTEDPVVPYALGKTTYTALHLQGYPVTWRSYPMPHSVCAQEIQDISAWIQDLWK